MKPLPDLPQHGHYQVTQVPEGLCVAYPVAILGIFAWMIWLLGFLLVFVTAATLAPSSMTTITTLVLAWAATIPLGVLLLAANFRHPLVLGNDGQVARGPVSVPASQVKRQGDWLKVGQAWMWLPVLRRDLDWLQASLAALSGRQPGDMPMAVPERADKDYSESVSSVVFLWFSLALLLGAFGWTAWTVNHFGCPAFPYWSRLWTVGGGLAVGLLLLGISGRNTMALSAFVFAALVFAWNANWVVDPTATTQNFRVLARFESGKPNPGFETRFLELEVPAELSAFRFVAYRGEVALGDTVACGLGRGAVGQPWLRAPSGWHDPLLHFERPDLLPMDDKSWQECVDRGQPMNVPGEFAPESLAGAFLKAHAVMK